MGQSVTWHDRRWQQALRACGLSRYEDFLEARPDDPAWERSTTKTYRLTATNPRDQRRTGLYLKQYTYSTRRWRFLLRRDKPAVEQRNYDYLRRRVGDVAPEVVVTGRRRRWMMLHDAFIVTVELEGAVQLDEYARAHWGGTPCHDERTRQDALIRHTAELVRRMHDARFYHVDLQWRNVLVRFGESPRNAVAFLIDAPRGGRRRLWLRRRHGRLRDLSSLDKLARVYLTRTQRLRWFTLYTGQRRVSRSGRRLISAVLADRARYERAKAGQLTSRV